MLDYHADKRKIGIIRVLETLQQIPPDGICSNTLRV
jgi:hypothetical protein